MAALRAVLGGRGGPGLCPPPPGQSRGAGGGPLLQLLVGRWLLGGQEVGTPREWVQREQLRRRNAYLGDVYGANAAAAIFTLSCGGRVRFEGEEDWTQPGGSLDPQTLHLPVVALDLSGSCVTYEGLDNLVSLPRLHHLDLSSCPHLSDWALSRLWVFGDVLRELSVANCPRVTERGLAALHHLRALRRLDVTGIAVPSPGLVRILLEEALPGCEIRGLDLGNKIPQNGEH